MSGGGKGGGTIDTTNEIDQTTTTAMDPYSQEARQRIIELASELYGQPQQYYPGQLVAPFSPDQLMSQSMTRGLATRPETYSTTPLADMAAEGAGNTFAQNLAAQQYLISPEYIQQLQNPLSNPFLMGALEAANRGTIAQFAGQALPAIRTQAGMTGGYGGSRQGIAEGLAATGTAQAIADRNIMALAQAQQAGQQMAQSALMGGLSAAQAPYGPLGSAADLRGLANSQALQQFNALGLSGAQQQAQAQNVINSEIARWMFNQQAPYNALGGLASIVGGLTPFGQTSTTIGTGINTQPLPQMNPYGAVIGGAFAGAGLSQLLGGAGGALGMFAAPQFMIPMMALGSLFLS